MNGLEALEEIKCDMEYVTRLDFVEPIVRGEVRDKLKKIYWRELDQLDQIEKELKALEIIKKKTSLDFNDIRNADNYDEYLKHFGKVIQEMLRSGESVHFAVTQDEFNLFKEVLKC